MPQPKVAVKLVLESNWDTSNTSISSVPSVHTGDYDQDAQEPQVTITGVSETARGGGETGVSAFSGSGLMQENLGLLQVDTWSDRGASDVNPKKLTREFAEETRRILLSVGEDIESELSNTTLDPTDLIWMTARSPPQERSPETERSPVVYGYLVEAGYYYQTTA